MADNDNGDRPVVELFVKAASDKMKNGACPICHRYFLAFYILRERGLVDLVVTTFLPENPPQEVLLFSNGKRYPLVKVHKGNVGGKDIAGMECDTVDEIESLLDRFECPDMLARRESREEERAEKTFEDLIKKFNLFMRNSSSDASGLVKILSQIDSYLHENGTKYLLTNRLGRADCYLLPILQHIRVAGRAYKEFDFPLEFSHLWAYMHHAYETDAFKESLPADGEIILHYDGKAAGNPIGGKKSFFMKDNRTLWIPKEVDMNNAVEEAEAEAVATNNGDH